MALRVEWSPEALEDIEAIASYIARDSAWYARAVVSRIVETAETIEAFPELGDPAIRERLAYNYRLIYRLESQRILVAAVVHGSRLLEPLLRR